jgi:hypothetical protein
MRQNTVAFDKFSGLERVEKAKEVWCSELSSGIYCHVKDCRPTFQRCVLPPSPEMMWHSSGDCSCWWSERMYLRCCYNRLPEDGIWVWRAMVEWYWQVKAEELRENSVPVPLCPPKIPRELTGVCTWSVHVEFVVEKVALGQLSLQVLNLSISFHRSFIFTQVSSAGWTVDLLVVQFHRDSLTSSQP